MASSEDRPGAAVKAHRSALAVSATGHRGLHAAAEMDEDRSSLYRHGWSRSARRELNDMLELENHERQSDFEDVFGGESG